MLNEKQIEQILEEFNLSEENKKNVIYTEKFVYEIIDFNNIEETKKILRKKLREIRKNIYFPKKFLFFHGTSKRNRTNILEKGLLKTNDKRKRSIQSTPGFVYLTMSVESAELFASMAYPNEKIDIYAVLVDAKDMKPDKDQIFNKNLYGNENLSVNIENSLIYGNGICVKKNIELYNIRLCNHIVGIENDIKINNTNQTIINEENFLLN